MSEINCYATEVVWGEPFPGVHLMQYREVKNRTDEPYRTNNGVELAEGQFGLTIINDPFLLFTQAFHLDSTSHLSDRQVNALKGEAAEEYTRMLHADMVIYERVNNELVGGLQDMAHLSKALTAAGYSPDEHGFPGIFVSNYLAKWLEGRKPKSVYRRMDLPQEELPNFTSPVVYSTVPYSQTAEQKQAIEQLLLSPWLQPKDRAKVRLTLDKNSAAAAEATITELQDNINLRKNAGGDLADEFPETE